MSYKKGKIYIVGLGPGKREYMVPEALEAIEKSEVIIGYKTYIKLVEDLLKNKSVISSGMRKEIDRCKKALEYAKKGNIVSLISSGDAGVYGMAGIMLEILLKEDSNIEAQVIPGVTAANAAAACLGAPLMHDYAVISLSDLLTDWEVIEKRIECAAKGDFIICLYNPKSKGRQKQIEIARKIMLKYKDKDTPVGIVRNAKREGEQIILTTLDKMLENKIDMLTVVVIGNSQTFIKNGKMVTPRGYKV
ncbi:precorrin-3B C(17)-methyltransferase [Thermohalobacter berrensis]|uniref:Precorrin-3B C(17)-methyltransferase n=1 Tax=Thermohalobacter berrensis TaxID=99594 RepID=A0A419SZB5_9FIRM|nr:precorrin-3B C(17)-methyltransferase [Thermohalobacter berrensis]RKD30602.1 precorrin-3B C(17)-methyltransferase [Thermohalobacter berrensis]